MPPPAVTWAATRKALASRTRPMGGFWVMGTISSPLDSTATLGFW